MSKVEIYTTPLCPYCKRAKALLDTKSIRYVEYDVSKDSRRFSEMQNRSQRRSVPQIFIDNHHVGGSDELVAAEHSGQLDELLQLEKLQVR